MSNELSWKILWVDDEIELLKSQILFLKQKGYTVETATMATMRSRCCAPARWT
ncbi:MAG: hypothetical protein V1794_07165 [Candidatus Glassbacteria bacterium]